MQNMLNSVLYDFALQMSRVAYEKNGGEELRQFLNRNTTSISGFEVLKNKNASCFVFTSERQAWVVFRGSDDLADWKANFNFLPREGVHRGILSEWLKLRNRVLEWISKHDTCFDGIFLTGHSLGGAIAILCAEEIFLKRQDGMLCILTFGSPPVHYGRRRNQFISRVLGSPDQTKCHCIRYIFRNDIVPRLPLLVGLKHVGERIQINSRGPTIRLFDWMFG